MKVSKVTFGIIYEATGWQFILGFVQVKSRPVIVAINVEECEYHKAKEVVDRFGCKINWKAVEEYGINSNAVEGGDGKSAFFPYLIS